MIGILVGTSTTYNNLVESVLRLSPIGWNLESGIWNLSPPHSDSPVRTDTTASASTFDLRNTHTKTLAELVFQRDSRLALATNYAATTHTSACSRLGTKQQDATGREMGGHTLDQGTE